MADYEDTKVTDLVINNMSQEKFEELKAAGELDPTQIYLTPTEESGGESLPDQTGNAGKFLTTDGTDASWGDALQNYSAINESIGIGEGNIVNQRSIAIGYNTVAGNSSDTTGQNVALGYKAKADAGFGNKATAIGANSAASGTNAAAFGASAKAQTASSTAIGAYSEAASDAIALGYYCKNTNPNTFAVALNTGGTFPTTFYVLDSNGNVPRERLKNLVEVLPTADNGYTTIKNYGNGYVEITGYTAIGTVGASTGSEVQIDLPAGYTMADANYWVNIAPTSETTMFDFKAEAKARSTTHFMVAYKNEDTTTGLTAAGVYWEVRGMLATE